MPFSDALEIYFPHVADFVFVKIAGGFIVKIDMRGSRFSAKHIKNCRLLKTPGFRLKTGPESKRRGPREGRNAPFSYTYAKNQGIAVPAPPPQKEPKSSHKGAQGLPSEAPEGPWRPPRDPSDLRRPKGPLQAPKMTPKDPKSTPRGLKDRTQKNKFRTLRDTPTIPLEKKIAVVAPLSPRKLFADSLGTGKTLWRILR